MTIIASTPAEINMFQVITIRAAIRMYANHGLKANRAYTPTNMLAMAGKLTGKSLKRGQFEQAFDALTVLVGDGKKMK